MDMIKLQVWIWFRALIDAYAFSCDAVENLPFESTSTLLKAPINSNDVINLPLTFSVTQAIVRSPNIRTFQLEVFLSEKTYEIQRPSIVMYIQLQCFKFLKVP